MLSKQEKGVFALSTVDTKVAGVPPGSMVNSGICRGNLAALIVKSPAYGPSGGHLNAKGEPSVGRSTPISTAERFPPFNDPQTSALEHFIL